VPQDRIRKFTEENKELAANLKAEMEKMLNPPKLMVAPANKKAAGSDLSSTRGSEERLTPVGRGQKRGRDYEIEKVRERPDSLLGFYFDISQVKPLNSKQNRKPSQRHVCKCPVWEPRSYIIIDCFSCAILCQKTTTAIPTQASVEDRSLAHGFIHIYSLRRLLDIPE